MSEDRAIIILPTRGVFAEFRIVSQQYDSMEREALRGTVLCAVFGYGTPPEEYVRATFIEIAIKTTLMGLLSHLTSCERELDSHVSERAQFIIVSLKCIGAAIMDNYWRPRDAPNDAAPDITLWLWTSANNMGVRAFLRYFMSFAALHFDDDVEPIVPDYYECTISDRLRAILDVFKRVVPYDLSDMRAGGIVDARVSCDRITIKFRERIGAHLLRIHQK